MGEKNENVTVEPVEDVVNHPHHYTYGKIEAVDMIDSAGWLADFCAGNALKYLIRHEHKGKKVEDLKKAQWYLNRLIEKREEEELEALEKAAKEIAKASAGGWNEDTSPMRNGIIKRFDPDGVVHYYDELTETPIPDYMIKQITTGLLMAEGVTSEGTANE